MFYVSIPVAELDHFKLEATYNFKGAKYINP